MCWILTLIRNEKWGHKTWQYLKQICKNRQEWWQCGLICEGRLEGNAFRISVHSICSTGKKESVDKKLKWRWEVRVIDRKWSQRGQKEMESVAQKEMIGSCYFQIGFEAWIQRSEKVKLTQNYKSRVWNLLCTDNTYIVYIEERSSCHGGLGDENGYHTEWQIRALEGQEEIAEPQNYWWKFKRIVEI